MNRAENFSQPVIVWPKSRVFWNEIREGMCFKTLICFDRSVGMTMCRFGSYELVIPTKNDWHGKIHFCRPGEMVGILHAMHPAPFLDKKKCGTNCDCASAWSVVLQRRRKICWNRGACDNEGARTFSPKRKDGEMTFSPRKKNGKNLSAEKKE